MDSLLAGGLFVLTAVYLVQRRVGYMLFWVILTYLVTFNMLKIPRTLAVLLGIGSIYVVSYFSTLEHFENEKKETHDEKPKSEPASADPHVDLGTTILHAYRNLTPEQIGGMRRDTKELMELQKELMGTLAEMKPAIEQGGQLLATFSQFFGQGSS